MSSRNNWQSLYPFSPHYVSLGEHRLHYIDEGQGRPLLMVHGNPTWSFYWRNLVIGLATEYRTLAIDHMGCGLSDKPQEYEYRLRRHIDNLVQFIDQLDLREITLVAHDWGGAIGLGAALARRERFASFVLFNTGAFPPPYIPWRIRLCRIPWLGTWGIRRLNLFARAAIRMAVAQGKTMAPDVKAGLLAPYDCWENRVAIDRFVQDIPGSPHHQTWQELEQLEQGLSQLADYPCQLIWGMQDWCFRPDCLDRLLEHFPLAETHRLTDASHYVVEDAPQQIIPIMKQFLSQADSTRE